MARPYIPDPSTITGSGAFDPWVTLDRKTDHDPRTETFTWPGAANDYTMRLDCAILEHMTLTVLGDGNALLPVRWTDSPGVGEVAIHHNAGLIRCNPSMATKSGSCAYTPIGSQIDAMWQATVQQEIKAAQASAADPVVDGGVW